MKNLSAFKDAQSSQVSLNQRELYISTKLLRLAVVLNNDTLKCTSVQYFVYDLIKFRFRFQEHN
jgi:hypothetical protein